jgi:hypothetical protein
MAVGDAIVRAGAASIVMGVGVWGVWRLVNRVMHHEALAELAGVAVPVAAGIAIYFLMARWLRIDELDQFLRIVRSRLRTKLG